jgi:hypothetical protein
MWEGIAILAALIVVAAVLEDRFPWLKFGRRRREPQGGVRKELLDAYAADLERRVNAARSRAPQA